MSSRMEGDRPPGYPELRKQRPGFAGIVSDAGFVTAYVRHNFACALEYRLSFITQVVSMIVNDSIWLIFWTLYFHRFPVIRGWGLEDVLLLWSVATTGYGLASGFCGNRTEVAAMIARGDLDYYLSLPRNVLLHVLVSRMSVSAWGDILFGAGIFLLFLRPDPAHFVLYVMLSGMAAVVLVSFSVLMESLAFFIGGAEGLGTQIQNALITFSTYPMGLFDGGVRLILFALVPAGFVTWVPVMLLKHFSGGQFARMAAYTLGLTLLACAVFERGLRRYESGNLLSMRG
ncbi:MAG: ABC transporter permease [Capsulimonadaceae bacterium]